jgi:hypothetical protein
MNDFAIIFQVVGGLLALFFIFLTYMNTKSWRWVHVTFMFLVFAATIAFSIYAAMTLKTRNAWVGLHDKTEKQVDELTVQIQRATRGDPKDPSAPSLVSARAKLAETVIDRGRVWRGAIPSFAGGVITVATTPPPDPNLPAPPPAKKNNIQPKTVLHAFREGQIQGADGTPIVVPVAYIGEFEVTAATDNSVTLVPTMPPDQQAAGPGQNYLPSWTLYENMPVDGHQWFDGTDEERQAVLPKIIPPPVLQSYLRDGREANANDPPEHVWSEVKFVKDYEVAVDASAATIESEQFNSEGQAVTPRLQRKGEGEDAGKVKFGPEPPRIPTAILDKQTAEELRANGIVEIVKSIYRRPLSDYERKLHGINDRVVELTGRLRQLDMDNKALLASTEKANEQSKLVEELKVKATDDLQKTVYERDEMRKYVAALTDRLTSVQTELSQLYRSNKVIAKEMAELNARITEDIDRRARQATAMRPRP